MDKNENKRYCKRCLTRDLIGKEEYFQNLQDYIANLEEEWKIEQEQYESRLAICLECDKLLQGMCRSCGCFVELRAVMKKNHCPYQKW